MTHPRKIGLLGPFGSGNLGDAAIQEAAIHNIRRYAPDSEIFAFSHNPQDTEWRHGIKCYPISRIEEKSIERARGKGFLLRKLYGLFERLLSIKREFRFLKDCYRILLPFDLLIMSGGGQLDDFWGGAWEHPYVLLKWSILAKMTHTRLAFLSVGAGLLNSRLSRWFVKMALFLSDYRSFRENKTREYVERLGVRKDNIVCPDLAYSYPVIRRRNEPIKEENKSITVGISPINAGAWTDQNDENYIYYRQTLVSFIKWLIENNYRILFFPSQVVMDTPIVEDIIRELHNTNDHTSHDDIANSVETLSDLLSEISETDIVVASRLHAVLLSTLMFKPVVAISYEKKVEILMNDLSCQDYTLDLPQITLESLKTTFNAIVANRGSVTKVLEDKVSSFVQQLDAQYKYILNI
jgi:polysaccharide pyruvyl transferase WcaK-like protein